MPAALSSTLLAVAIAEPAAQPVSIQTALLIILGIGFLFAARSLADLHRRVDALAAKARPKKSQNAATPLSSGTLSPEIVAVISAAVFEAIGSDHRIVSITSPRQDNPSWSQEGRRQVFAGRRVR